MNKNLNISGIVGQAWGLFKANVKLILMIMVVFIVYYVVEIFISGMLFRNQAYGQTSVLLPSLVRLFFFLVYLVLQLGLIFVSLKLVDGKGAVVKDIYSFPDPLKKALRYVGASILYGLMVIGGLVLFVIPGIYLAVRFQFYGYFILDKNAGVIDSLKMSGGHTNKNILNLFLLDLLLGVLNLVGSIPLGLGLLITIPLSTLAMSLAYRKLQ